jgi:hypothetical protein
MRRIRKVSGKDEEDEVKNGEVLQEKWKGKTSRLLAGMRIQGPELRTSEMTLLTNRAAWDTYISGTRQGSVMRLCWESDPNVEGPLSKGRLVSDQKVATSSLEHATCRSIHASPWGSRKTRKSCGKWQYPARVSQAVELDCPQWLPASPQCLYFL